MSEFSRIYDADGRFAGTQRDRGDRVEYYDIDGHKTATGWQRDDGGLDVEDVGGGVTRRTYMTSSGHETRAAGGDEFLGRSYTGYGGAVENRGPDGEYLGTTQPAE